MNITKKLHKNKNAQIILEFCFSRHRKIKKNQTKINVLFYFFTDIFLPTFLKPHKKKYQKKRYQKKKDIYQLFFAVSKNKKD
jgi:hypothetical protein